MDEYHFLINGNEYDVNILKMDEEEAVINVNGTEYTVNIEQLFKQKTPRLVRTKVVPESAPRQKLTDAPGRDLGFNTVKAPLPGLILEIGIKVGDQVKAGQSVMKMEAMKMENEIQSPVGGKVVEIFVKQGESVLEGASLVKIA